MRLRVRHELRVEEQLLLSCSFVRFGTLPSRHAPCVCVSVCEVLVVVGLRLHGGIHTRRTSRLGRTRYAPRRVSTCEVTRAEPRRVVRRSGGGWIGRNPPSSPGGARGG